MRIAYVYDAVAPWRVGGVQTRLWEFGQRLAKRGHDIHWYGLRYWDGPETIHRRGITYHGVMEPQQLYVDGRRSIREAIEYAANLIEPLWGTDVDIIDCQGFPYFPTFASKLGSITGGSTLVLTWHEVWGSYWNQYLGRIKGMIGRMIERLTTVVPDVHVAVSERTQRDVAELGATAELLPNGVDLGTIAEVKPSEAPVDVAFVGRLIKEKGAHLLVEAVNRLSSNRDELRVDIVGNGPEHERLQRLIEQEGLGNQVRLRGELSERNDVLALLKAADTYVLPSSREGFGITVLEALACGTPVVTTEHPQNAATALVTDGITGAVTKREPAAIADGIRTATACDSDDCLDTAMKYSWDRLTDSAESLYREVA